jgi:hypothetical protein
MRPSLFNPDTVGPFSIFVVLYYASILLELVEHWDHPLPTVFFCGLALLCLLRIDRLTFLLFLVASTAYFLFFRFPEVPNHVNLILFVNVALIAATLHSLLKERIIDLDAFYERVAPILRLSIIVTFSVAGFHKLNLDFINPVSSCITRFTGNIADVLKSDFLGIGVPTIVPVGFVALTCAGALIRERQRDFALPPIDWKAVLAPPIAIASVATILLLLTGGEFLDSGRNTALFVIAVFVLCWQLVEGPLLLIPRFQWVALVLSLIVHAQLAMIRIVDFQSVAVALLATFVPADMWRAWARQSMVGFGSLKLHRAQIYLLLNVVIGGTLMLLHNHTALSIPRQYVVTGILFNISILIVAWPFLTGLFSRSRTWHWHGTPVFHAATPRYLFIFPLCLLLFGMTSHLGLRTAGNFSMFSNLRTEGDLSNHLILRGNPLKFFDYQDDLVTVIEIDDELARIGHQYSPLEGRQIPMVEFRKLLLQWRLDGRPIPVTISYRGEVMRFDDIATAPGWRVGGRDWEMRLLDFRIVQEGRPNACRW